jgi:membrane-associated protein
MQGFINNYGILVYLILFVIIFCETGLVFAPFLPGDSLIFAAGAFAGLSELNYFLLLIVIIAAAILGDSLNYLIGNKFGKAIINSKKHRFIKQEHLDRSYEFVKKYGSKAVFLARFMPIIRTIVPFVLGFGKLDYRKFIKYNILGAIVWVGLFLNLGYFFGNISYVKDHFSLILLTIIFISLIPIISAFIQSKMKVRVSKKGLVHEEDQRNNES